MTRSPHPNTANPPTRGTRLAGPEREKLRSRAAQIYAGGATIAQTARQIDRSYGLTRMLIDESEVAIRPRGGQPPQPITT
jgi:hypothetical protein